MIALRPDKPADALLAIALITIWVALAPISARAGSDSLLCGFLVGFGSTEHELYLLTHKLPDEEAKRQARIESQNFAFSYARFSKWYPDIAEQIEPYVRSRRLLLDTITKDGREAAITAYLEHENRSQLRRMERVLERNACSTPFDSAKTVGKMASRRDHGLGGWNTGMPAALQGPGALLGLGVLSAIGLGGVIWREAHRRLLRMRYIVKLGALVEYGKEQRKGQINDLSQVGAKLFFPEGHVYEPGERLDIRWEDELIRGRIRWIGVNVAGVEFRRPLKREKLREMRNASRMARRIRRRRSSRNGLGG